MSISTEIYHLQELSRYASEKPYTMRYVPEGGTAVSNVLREKHVVSVKDVRDSKHKYTLDQNGFMISQLAGSLDYGVFDSQEAIEKSYFPELETILLAQFPRSTIDFVSYLVATPFLIRQRRCAEISTRYVRERLRFLTRRDSNILTGNPTSWPTLTLLPMTW
jgi:hypothetical protein